MMQNRLCKTLLCSASKLRIYSRRQEQQFLQNDVVAMSFVSSSSFSGGGVWGRRRVIRESFVDDDVAFQRGRMRSLSVVILAETTTTTSTARRREEDRKTRRRQRLLEGSLPPRRLMKMNSIRSPSSALVQPACTRRTSCST